MSTENLALTETLETRPVELEHSLSSAMRQIGRRIVERPEIVRALEIASQLQAGYVITTDEQAAEVADLVAVLIDGEKALAEGAREALRIPKGMEEALKDAVGGAKDAIAAARQTGNQARVSYQATLRRRAAEIEAKARESAREAARIAAEEAAQTGEDAPPPAEIAAIEVPRVVSGGVGKMGIQVRLDVVGVEDWAACPREWLILASPTARAAFLAACMEKKVQKPQPGESILWRGVRFASVELAVNRRR